MKKLQYFAVEASFGLEFITGGKPDADCVINKYSPGYQDDMTAWEAR
ncbi:MAG TPA: hypothetical protein VLA49_21295 [Anaerolineales bacterium]|nr:hypothetical protein [Anaerolineales bacterium]